jgi:hypothetical protein
MCIQKGAGLEGTPQVQQVAELQAALKPPDGARATAWLNLAQDAKLLAQLR